MGKNSKKVCLTIALIVSSLFIGGCTIGSNSMDAEEVGSAFVNIFGEEEIDRIQSELNQYQSNLVSLVDTTNAYNGRAHELQDISNELIQRWSQLVWLGEDGHKTDLIANLVNGIDISNEQVVNALARKLASDNADTASNMQTISLWNHSNPYLDVVGDGYAEKDEQDRLNIVVKEFQLTLKSEYIDDYKAMYPEGMEDRPSFETYLNDIGMVIKVVNGVEYCYPRGSENTPGEQIKSTVDTYYKPLSIKTSGNEELEKLAVIATVNSNTLAELSKSATTETLYEITAKVSKTDYLGEFAGSKGQKVELTEVIDRCNVYLYDGSSVSSNKYGIGISLSSGITEKPINGSGVLDGLRTITGSTNMGTLLRKLIMKELMKFECESYTNEEYYNSTTGAMIGQNYSKRANVSLLTYNYHGGNKELLSRFFANGEPASGCEANIAAMYNEYYYGTNNKIAIETLLNNAITAKLQSEVVKDSSGKDVSTGRSFVESKSECTVGPFTIEYTLRIYSNAEQKNIKEKSSNLSGTVEDLILSNEVNDDTTLVKGLMHPFTIDEWSLEKIRSLTGREVRILEARKIYGHSDESHTDISLHLAELNLSAISKALNDGDANTLSGWYSAAARSGSVNGSAITDAVLGDGSILEIHSIPLSVGSYEVGRIYWVGLSKSLTDSLSNNVANGMYKVIEVEEKALQYEVENRPPTEVTVKKKVLYRVKYPIGVVSEINIMGSGGKFSKGPDTGKMIYLETARHLKNKDDLPLLYLNLETLAIENHDGNKVYNLEQIGYTTESFLCIGKQRTSIFEKTGDRKDWVFTMEPVIVMRDYLEGVYTGGLVHSNDDFSVLGRRIRLNLDNICKTLDEIKTKYEGVDCISEIPIGIILDASGQKMNKNYVTVGELCSILNGSETDEFGAGSLSTKKLINGINQDITPSNQMVKLKTLSEWVKSGSFLESEMDLEKGVETLKGSRIYTGLFGRYSKNLEENTDFWVGYGVIEPQGVRESVLAVLPVICVDRDINDSSLIEGWLDYEIGSGEGLEGWNMWLEGKLEYYIDLTKLYNSFKKNYRFALAEEDIIELDLITIGKIQNIYDEEDTQNEGRSFRTVTIIAGVILTIYGLMLIAAWMIDVNIGGTDYKILGRITIGKLVAIASTEEMIDEQVKYVDLKGIIVKALIAICTGVLLMTIDVIATFYWILGLLKGVFELIEKVVFNR